MLLAFQLLAGARHCCMERLKGSTFPHLLTFHSISPVIKGKKPTTPATRQSDRRHFFFFFPFLKSRKSARGALGKLSPGDSTGANLRLATKKTDRRFLIQTEKRRRLLQADEKGKWNAFKATAAQARRRSHATVALREHRERESQAARIKYSDLVLISSAGGGITASVFQF